MQSPTPSLGGSLVPLLSHNRKDCYNLYCPDTSLSKVQVARALSQQYPSIAQSLQLIPTDESYVLQALEPDAPDLQKLVRNGLDLGDVHATVIQLTFVSSHSSIVELCLRNVLVGKNYKRDLNGWLRGYGTILDDFVCVFGGTAMHTGEVRVLLDSNGSPFLPPPILKQEHIGYTTDITCDIVGSPEFCCKDCRSVCPCVYSVTHRLSLKLSQTNHNTSTCPQASATRPGYMRSQSSTDVRHSRRPSYFDTTPSPFASPYATPLSSPRGSPHASPQLLPASASYGWRSMAPLTPSLSDERLSTNMFGPAGRDFSLQGRGWPSNGQNYCTY